MQWKMFPTMLLIFTGLNGTGTGSSQNLHSSTGTLALGTPGIHQRFLARKCELARQFPTSLKPFQMIEKSAKSYMKRFRAAGCEFRILMCA
jgi:hypothetical protein